MTVVHDAVAESAKLIAATRADLGMSRAAFGAMTGRSEETIRRYEDRAGRPPAIFFHNLIEAEPGCGLRFNDFAPALGFRRIEVASQCCQPPGSAGLDRERIEADARRRSQASRTPAPGVTGHDMATGRPTRIVALLADDFPLLIRIPEPARARCVQDSRYAKEAPEVNPHHDRNGSRVVGRLACRTGHPFESALT